MPQKLPISIWLLESYPVLLMILFSFTGISSAKDSMCEGAILHFERRPALLHCNICSTEYEIETSLQPCPECGSPDIKVKSGEEFYVDSIEIEKREDQ